VDAGGVYRLDDPLGRLSLSLVVIEDAGAVLGADVVALLVQGRRVVGGEEDLE
jgi:hypothetical protein